MADTSVVFAGTPEFAVASLRALLDAGIRPSLVLTQPDRPAGRGRRLTPSPVRRVAEDYSLDVATPVSLRKSPEVLSRLTALEPDFLIVAAYGLILPPAILSIPRIAPLNVHASLLPRWRGAAPIQAAILAGDTTSGISLMQMEAGLDTGPVYATRTTPVEADDTAQTLHDRLATIGGELLVASLPGIVDGSLVAVAQDDSVATYAPKIAKDDAIIDWSLDAAQLERAVRAYVPWPVATTRLDGQPLKVYAARAVPGAASAAPGTVVAAGSDGIAVAAGAGTLLLTSVQLAGRRRISAADLANQRQLVGVGLGS